MSRSSSASSSRSCGSESNAQDLKPIKAYLSDRRELARQLFKSVKPEKIRMMLPQILKNADPKDLEERCAGELCGMSEARILCILKGRAMSGSSDTGDTDDSGPSLEIISDTEEWLTDTEITVKEEPSSSVAGKSKKSKPLKTAKNKVGVRKKKVRDKGSAKSKGSPVARFDSDLKLKKEKDAEVPASAAENKEGESLLDLLELEMRARAIRALIRKEEDTPQLSKAKEKGGEAKSSDPIDSSVGATVRPSIANNGSKNGNDTTCPRINEEAKKSREDSRPVGATETGAEDEDVVFVVAKPTPTIELVSSEEDEMCVSKDVRKRIGNGEEPKRTASQRVTEVGPPRETSGNDRTVTIDRSNDGSDSLKIVVTKRLSDSSVVASTGKAIKARKICEDGNDKVDARRSVPENETNSHKIVETNEARSPGKGLFKKIRKKANLRTKRKPIQDDESLPNASLETREATVPAAVDANENDRVTMKVSIESAVKTETADDLGADVAIRADEATTRVDETKFATRVESERPRVATSGDDRLDDFEEIIDLDDYPDDMEDFENKDEAKKSRAEIGRTAQVCTEREAPQTTGEAITASGERSESAETWASRYYQTDDVQNVIKESKIQSEIRKRLRERQRLSKSNNSPKLPAGSPGDGSTALEKVEEKMLVEATTGSVREYLALKNVTSEKNVKDEDNAVQDSGIKSPQKFSEVSADVKDTFSSSDPKTTSSTEESALSDSLSSPRLPDLAATVR